MFPAEQNALPRISTFRLVALQAMRTSQQIGDGKNSRLVAAATSAIPLYATRDWAPLALP